MSTEMHSVFRSRWWMPAFSTALGLAMLAAFWIGGDARSGLWALAVMVGVGLVFLLGGRSETISGLGGPGRDERWSSIDLRATAAAGLVLIMAVIGAWLWEIAHGRDGSPYGQLCAISGVVYVAAVALLRARG